MIRRVGPDQLNRVVHRKNVEAQAAENSVWEFVLEFEFYKPL